MQAASRRHRQPPYLADDGRQPRRAQPFLDRAQNVLVAPSGDQRQPGRVEPMPGQPRPVQVGPPQAPQDRAGAEPGENAGGKSGNGGAVLLVAIRAGHLVHRAEGKPAARQGLVDRGEAERQDVVPRRPLQLPDAVAQRLEVSHAGHEWGNTVPRACSLFVPEGFECQPAPFFWE